MTTIPPETRAEMARLYVDERRSSREVAALTFWSQHAVLSALRAEGVTIRSRSDYDRRRLSDDDVARTVELYQSGLSQDEVAHALGIARDTVKYRLLRAGVGLRTRTDMNIVRRRKRLVAGGPCAFTERQQQIIDELARHRRLTTPQIAEKLNLKPHMTRRVLRQLRYLGFVRDTPTHTGRGHPYVWTLTEARPADALKQVLSARTPLSRETDENMLPVQPLRDWLASLGEEDVIIAARLDVTERRLYAIRNGQPRVSLALADRMLTNSGRPERLEDLWPHLADTDDEMEMAA